MELQLSAHSAATLIVRLSRTKLSLVAQAAAKHEPKLRSLILRTMRDARDLVPMNDLTGVLSLGHPGTGAPLYVMEPVIQFIADTLMGDGVTLYAPLRPSVRTLEAKKKDLPDILYDAVMSGGRAAAKPLLMSFDSTNLVSVEWAHDHAAKRIVEISEDVRDAIRLTVVDAFESGVAPRDLAKIIRANVGLTMRDAGAVMKRHVKMLVDGVKSDVAVKRAEAYATKLLRRRALTVARTELMKASNEGARELWAQARSKGLLDSTAMKVWIAFDPCPICAPLDGETVPVDGVFSIGGDPPAHPNCRCTIGLV